jgi:replication-associated recombination protein RarA
VTLPLDPGEGGAKAVPPVRASKPRPPTVGGYPMDEITSWLQKAIRRGDEEAAAFCASELDLSGQSWLLWRRLKIIASEDVGLAQPGIATEVSQLFMNWLAEKKLKKGTERIFLIHCVLLLARAPKSRIVDNLLIALYEGERPVREIPHGYVRDMHTRGGRQRGRGVDHFFDVAAKLVNCTLPDPYEERAREARRHPIRRPPAEEEEP